MGSSVSSFLGGVQPHSANAYGFQDEARTRRKHNIPTESDVYAVQEILLNFIPIELINYILDEAEYWPRLACQHESNPPLKIPASLFPQSSANYCYFITPPIPDKCHLGNSKLKVKKVVFTIRSHDQGWGGDPGLTGAYQGSWTWFEAAIFRGLVGLDFISDPEAAAQAIQNAETGGSAQGIGIQVQNPVDGSKVWQLQRNVRASAEEVAHQVTWTVEGSRLRVEANPDVSEESGAGQGSGFVSELREGDRIAIYARALFPGWENYIRGVEIQLFYSL